MTFDLLIATRPHRHEQLCGLLAELDRQMLPGAGALLYRDDRASSYGQACQALLEASGAEYVAFFDDDDWPAASYMERVLAALETGPDYVGWPQIYSIDGVRAGIIVLSLHDRSAEYPQPYGTDDISHQNPIRRELALLGAWSGHHGADQRWAAQVRATGKVRAEAWISEPMYERRFSYADGSLGTWRPHKGPWPVIPSYDWLKEI